MVPSPPQTQFLKDLKALCIHHYENCDEYRLLIDAQGGLDSFKSIAEIPPLMVAMFKQHRLKSISESEIFKELKSSGTTGLQSRIYLDRNTSQVQTKALVDIVQSYIGKQRYPMILIDHNSHFENKHELNARGAGIQGLSIFGRDHFSALDKEMNFKVEEFLAYLKKYEGQPILMFGFTFMVWAYFLKYLVSKDIHLNLADSILLHSGGWKKMQEQSVDNMQFKELVKERLGISRVHNFYGMAEQTGSIFMECEQGYLHESEYGKILVREASLEFPRYWRLCDFNESGLIQVLSSLPESYPGHSIMTEDLGTIIGEDTCLCGRSGKYFQVNGRLPKVHQRGCSDV